MANYSLVWNLGKQVQVLPFSEEVWLEHVSTLQGSIQFERDLFPKSVSTGSRKSRHSFKSHDGIGSLLHCLFGDFLINFLTLSSVRGRKERDISSFIGTIGIVIGSGSWLSNFVLIFWIFIIKKSPNASARSFNDSESGYCSCCNGFVSDLMISKNLFWSPAHS